MPYRQIKPDAATCQPQIFDDQPETSVSLPQLRSELALQVILSSFVPLNRSDICGSKHVMQLLTGADDNGVYDLIASGHVALVMEENVASLYDWWKNSKVRIAHLARIDANYVRGVSDRLETHNAFRLSFQLRNTAADYYKLLNAALASESYRRRCSLVNREWVTELDDCIRQFDSHPHKIGRAELYKRLNITLTSEQPNHHYSERERAMKRLIDACYIGNIPLHQNFSYSVRAGHVPLFFYGPGVPAAQKRKRWHLRRTRFISGLPNLSVVHFGRLVDALGSATASLRTDYLSRIERLRANVSSVSQLTELFDAARQYLEDLFPKLRSNPRTHSIFCLSAEQSGPVRPLACRFGLATPISPYIPLSALPPVPLRITFRPLGKPRRTGENGGDYGCQTNWRRA